MTTGQDPTPRAGYPSNRSQTCRPSLSPPWPSTAWNDPRETWLIDPKLGFPPDIILGDPQVILPGEFDASWHMFLIGRGHFFRLDSTDGLRWSLVADHRWYSGPAYVTTDGRQWIVYYSKHGWDSEPRDSSSTIVARTSPDLATWSDPVTVLTPELDWEKEGRVVQVRNPCVVLLPNGRWRMYYCGGTNWMEDMHFEEPKYVGYAESASPFGPFTKAPQPILRPDANIWYRNFGAGALKVYGFGDQFLGLYNGVYLDRDKHSRAAISVLLSQDGINWVDAPYNPIVLPSDGRPKKTLIYQLDLRCYQNRLWLYYNAREGWAFASEGICLTTLDWTGIAPRKLWPLKVSS